MVSRDESVPGLCGLQGMEAPQGSSMEYTALDLPLNVKDRRLWYHRPEDIALGPGEGNISDRYTPTVMKAPPRLHVSQLVCAPAYCYSEAKCPEIYGWASWRGNWKAPYLT